MPRKTKKKATKAPPAPVQSDTLSAVRAQLEERAKVLRGFLSACEQAELELAAIEAALEALKAGDYRGGPPIRRATAPPTGPRRAAPGNQDAPRKRAGRLPKVGVESFAPANDQERMDKIGTLRAQGLVRCGAGKPLGPGEYDVVETGGGDVTLLWRPKVAA